MTAVLPVPRRKGNRLSSDHLVHSPSQSFFLGDRGSYLKTPDLHYYEAEHSSSLSSSSASSAPTSPEVTYTSFPIPASETTPILFDGSGEEDDDDEIVFPSYETDDYFNQARELDPPTSVVSPPQTSSSVTTSYQDNPPFDLSYLPKCVGDDICLEHEPELQVDYLSHDWNEEDIWASWRYVVAKKDRYSDSTRLENASWRTWSKSKNKLRTVSPESLDW